MSEAETGDSEQPLMAHLLELRARVLTAVAAWFIGMIICYNFANEIYAFLVEPLAQGFEQGEARRLIYTSLTEAFFTYIKLAFWAGFFLAFPVIALQFYRFVAPGLYKHEKGALLPYLIISPLLFFAGAALAYYGVMPMAWQFFIGFEEMDPTLGLPIQLEAKVSEYLGLVMQILFAFGLAFQLPIVLTLLARIGLITSEALAKKRRYAVIGIITAAALLTPPDIISQIGLFIPLYLLYEISIICCRIMQRKHEENQEAEADA